MNMPQMHLHHVVQTAEIEPFQLQCGMQMFLQFPCFILPLELLKEHDECCWLSGCGSKDFVFKPIPVPASLVCSAIGLETCDRKALATVNAHVPTSVSLTVGDYNLMSFGFNSVFLEVFFCAFVDDRFLFPSAKTSFTFFQNIFLLKLKNDYIRAVHVKKLL